ncbi:MAG TPA: CsbD family protein [Rhodanobacteraceae bacterium]|nr:CsbD family protein [Rhodanobacteraceae bacterium]
MSDDRIRDEWLQITDKLRRRWRKLTAEDVLCSGGNSDYLARLLQERYGVDWNEAVLQVTEFESELWPDAQDG